jgi:NitT/TauT family transport system substrate-binding protein
VVFAGALVAALVFAGTGAAGRQASTAPQLSQPTVRWAGVGGTYETILFVAQYEGWFKKEGLTVERVVATGGTAISAALASHSIEFASLGAQELALADDKKLGFVGLANHAKGPTEFAVISNDVAKAAGITATSSFADKMHALRGKTVGLGAPGSTTTTVGGLTLKNYGLVPGKDVTTVNLGSGPALFSAFSQGRIDAFFWIPPLTHNADGVLADFRQAQMWNGVNWAAWTTTTSFLSEHPDTVEAFLRAMIKAWNYTLKFPEAAAAIAARALPLLSTNPKDFKAALDADLQSWLGGLLFTPFGYQKALSIASNSSGRPVNSTLATATDVRPLLRASKQVGIGVGRWDPVTKKPAVVTK